MMSDENEHERRDEDRGIRWWVRYALVPVTVAVVAGISVIKAAELAGISSPPEAPPIQIEIPSQPLTVVVSAPQATAPPVVFPPTLPTPEPTSVPTEQPQVIPVSPEPPTDEPDPVQTEAPARLHTVRRGEHLYCIGRAYGVDPAAIASANQLLNPSLLYPGQVLTIPMVPWVSIPYGPICEAQFSPPYSTEMQSGSAPSRPVIYLPMVTETQPTNEVTQAAPQETVSPEVTDLPVTETVTPPPTEAPVTEVPPTTDLPPTTEVPPPTDEPTPTEEYPKETPIITDEPID
jgi:LysM repeat protein